MEALSLPRAAALGFLAGAGTAIGVMCVYALRTAVTITRQERWMDIRWFLGIGAKKKPYFERTPS